MIEKIKDKICNTNIGFILNDVFSLIELKIMSFYHDSQTIDLLKELIREDKPFLLKPSELFMVYSFAKNQKDIDGDYAEVGVFKGTTAKALCKVKGDKHLYLFDTFEGLPSVDSIDDQFKKKMYQSNFDKVKQKLADYPNVHIYKGLFPETGVDIKDRKFAFVHLDVDTFQSTKDCLEFFYSRVSPNGIIISHDYHMQGVKKAFNDFFINKPEKATQLSLSQCIILKR